MQTTNQKNYLISLSLLSLSGCSSTDQKASHPGYKIIAFTDKEGLQKYLINNWTFDIIHSSL